MSSQSEKPPAEDADGQAAGASGLWAPGGQRRVSAWQAARCRREHERGRERVRGRRRRKQGSRPRRWVPETEAAAAGETEADEAIGGARDSGDRWVKGGVAAEEIGVDS